MRAPSYIPSVKKVSPQNGGFIKAKLTRPRIFCYKNNVRNIQNGGFIKAKSGPLIRHQARILYLLILWDTHTGDVKFTSDHVSRFVFFHAPKTP